MARITINQIQEEAKALNWVLVSQQYKNLDTEIEFVCPEGHKVITTYGKWRAKHSCPICDAPKMELSDRVAPKSKGVTRILALDQASHTTGWAIYDNDTVIKYGIYQCKDDEFPKRAIDLKTWLLNMLNIWRPDTIVLEDIQMQEKKQNRNWENDDGDHIMNINTFKTLAQLQGVLENLLYEQGVSYSFVHTAVWRKSCGIKGKYRDEKKKSAKINSA